MAGRPTPRSGSAAKAPGDSKDVPRAGFTCASYADGHNVHYVAVLKVAPDHTPVPARLQREHGTLTLKAAGASIPVYTHNPAALELLVWDLGGQCRWYPKLRLLCWPGKGVRHWASVALAPVGECLSAEAARLAEIEMWT